MPYTTEYSNEQLLTLLKLNVIALRQESSIGDKVILKDNVRVLREAVRDRMLNLTRCLGQFKNNQLGKEIEPGKIELYDVPKTEQVPIETILKEIISLIKNRRKKDELNTETAITKVMRQKHTLFQIGVLAGNGLDKINIIKDGIKDMDILETETEPFNINEGDEFRLWGIDKEIGDLVISRKNNKEFGEVIRIDSRVKNDFRMIKVKFANYIDEVDYECNFYLVERDGIRRNK